MTLIRFSRRIRRRPQVELLEGRTLLNAGALDTSFGGTGMVATQIQLVSKSFAVAVQPDLKVVVAGFSASASTPTHFTIVRYNPNGTLDTSFGSGGVAVIPLSTTEDDGADAVAIQPNGQIVVAGWADVDGQKSGEYAVDWAVVRLNANGTLDTTFGGGTGYVLTNFVPPPKSGIPYDDFASAIAIQSNGQIVVAGQGTVGSTDGIAVARYNANGSLDTTFGTGGKVVDTGIAWTGFNGVGGQMVAVDGSGRIDVVGTITVGSTEEMAVARYLPNGTLDSTFGTGGVAGILPAGASDTVGTSVGLQSTGQIVAYGYGNYSGMHSGVPTLVRLNTNGILDTTFGTGGVYTESRMMIGTTLVIEPDDEILAAGDGWANGEKDYQFFVTLVLANGSSYDPAFGTNGLAETAWNPADIATPYSVALGPDGNIVVTGNYNNTDFATARFLGDSTSSSSSLAAAGSASTTNAPDSNLGLAVLDQSLFIDSLTSAKRRSTI